MDSQKPAYISLLTLKFIWGVLTFTQFVYFLLAWSMYGKPTFRIGGQAESLSIMFSTTALGSVFAAFFLFKLLSKSLKHAVSFDDAKQKFFLPFIIRLVLIETCSILGFAYSSMEEENRMFYFSLISITAFMLCFPTKSKIKSLMK